MNTDIMFSSKSDMWETPQDFFDKLNDEIVSNLREISKEEYRELKNQLKCEYEH